MKHIRRIFITLILLAITFFFVNANTLFFKNIDDYLPYLGDKYPAVADLISSLSYDADELIAKIPSLAELTSKFRNVELPIDPDDIAANFYQSSDVMLAFNNRQNLSAEIDGDKITVYGQFANPQDKYIVFRFISKTEDVLKQYTACTDNNGHFNKAMQIPDETFQLAVFTGPEQYGNFSSFAYDYIYFTNIGEKSYKLADSPVYSHNITAYEKSKSISVALSDTRSICKSNSAISALALQITSAHSEDYEKALALHDWICRNIYYDTDSITANKNDAPYAADDVLAKKRAVCLGYSNLYAALCRSVGIPCNVVTGYALGVDSAEKVWNSVNSTATDANHAWNEVHIGNRWIIVDTTWDSGNVLADGVPQTADKISHLYFDSNIKFFSTNHKIFEYVR